MNSTSRRRRGWRWGGLLCTALLLVACSNTNAPKPGPGDDPDAGPGDGGDSSSASSRIGSAGGEVVLGAARLVIPPGALSEELTLRLSATNEPAPPGYVVFSKIYRFEPTGARFAVPVRLSLPFTGDASLATFHLSRESAPGFDALPTQVTGDVASTEVLHLGVGFVAAIPGVWNQSQWDNSIWQ